MTAPSMRRAMSLRLRLFLVILAPLLLVSALLAVWRFEAAQATAQQLFDRGLLAAALAISRDVAISEGDALSPNTRQLISDAGGGEVFYHVTGPGGIYVTGYAYPPAARELRTGAAPQYRIADYRGEPVRVLRMSETRTIDNLTGEAVVTVWQRVSDRNDFATSLALRALGLMAAFMAALAVITWFGVQVGLRPLNDLREAIERRSPNDLGRIQRPVPREVEGIVATLNRLLGQVRDSIQEHQAFISDAAHQLRNPASALLSLAETLPGISDPAERHRREQDLIGAARRSALLAEQLLSLERLRYDGPAKDKTFDLGDLARDICADMAPEVLGHDIAFQYEPGPAPLPVRGDPILVGEAVRNLIDNALRHGGPELGGIAVATCARGGCACLSVADDGRGLPPSAAEQAFRRFGQISPGDGSGLGLSIVREVARGHGGDATVEPAEKGACLTIRLPLFKPPGAGSHARAF